MSNTILVENTDSFSITKILIIFAAMLVSMLEIIDITTINVAIPTLMGQYNVSVHTANWVVSAYVIASAIVTPLSGRLLLIFGQRRLLVLCIFGFSIASILCGVSSNINEIIIFRVFQGAFGACLVPLSEYILLNNFNKTQYRLVLGIWGMGVLFASVVGPLLGGLIMAYLNWRWIFFINIPVVIVAAIIILTSVTESKRVSQSLDYIGLTSLCVAIGSFEYLLNEGEHFYWLESKLIVYLLVIAIISTLWFLYRTIRKKDQGILDLRIFKDKKFSLCVISITFFSIIFMGVNAILPVFEQEFLHFTPLLNGLTSFPGGIAAIVGIVFAMLLVKYLDNRYIIWTGIVMCFYGTYLLAQANLNVSMSWISYTLVIRTFGFGLFFFPITLISVLDLPKEYLGLAPALFNFARNIGISIGVNFTSSWLNTLVQHNWTEMRGSISPYQTGAKLWLTKQNLAPNLSITDPVTMGLFTSYVAKASFLKAFITISAWGAIAILILIPLLYFIGKVKLKEISMPAG